MSDLVKAEAQAVRTLRRGIATYAEQVRSIVSSARRESQTDQRRATECLDAHKRNVRRKSEELRSAEAALAASPPEQRSRYEREVRSAQGRLAASKAHLERVKAAEQAIGAVNADLAKTLSSIEALVGEHSGASASALNLLDQRLSEITSNRLASAAKGALVTFGMAAQIATTAVDGAKLAGNVSQGAIPTADNVTSSQQLQDQRTEEQHQLWAEVELDRRSREAGKLRRKSEGK